MAYISNPANMAVLTADELAVVNGAAHIESIPWLNKKDLPVFDCAAPHGNGIRAISPAGHVLDVYKRQPPHRTEAAAAHPFYCTRIVCSISSFRRGAVMPLSLIHI